MMRVPSPIRMKRHIRGLKYVLPGPPLSGSVLHLKLSSLREIEFELPSELVQFRNGHRVTHVAAPESFSVTPELRRRFRALTVNHVRDFENAVTTCCVSDDVLLDGDIVRFGIQTLMERHQGKLDRVPHEFLLAALWVSQAFGLSDVEVVEQECARAHRPHAIKYEAFVLPRPAIKYVLERLRFQETRPEFFVDVERELDEMYEEICNAGGGKRAALGGLTRRAV